MKYIDAEKIPWTDLNEGRGGVNVYITFLEKVARMPAADVQEVRHGRWIWKGEEGDSRFMCSVCHSKEHVPTCNGKPTVWFCCPNCGALMVNKDD